MIKVKCEVVGCKKNKEGMCTEPELELQCEDAFTKGSRNIAILICEKCEFTEEGD